ncbi:MAG: hypothetical protein M3Y81_03380 [Chloroflexota bacterium]|nr:hypothetical protein [Chloroflexota bacterium]
MQGRPGQGNGPWEQYSHPRFAATNGSNGTGKQRAIPLRPPGMARLDRPPTTSRVSRPLRPPPRRRSRGWWLVIGTLLLVVCGVLTFVGVYVVTNVSQALNTGAAPATTVGNFLAAVGSQNYAQAYSSLGPAITISTRQDEFMQQATQDDHCFGMVTNYTEVSGSAQENNNVWTYSYTITRSKVQKPYQLTLTLQQDSDGQWRIASYTSDGNGNDLGPSVPSCQ